MEAIWRRLREEKVLLAFTGLLLLLSAFYPERIKHYPSWVDWNTLASLAGLLIIATGIESSGFLHLLAQRALNRLRSERQLALTLVLLSAAVSTFLTNDITLFFFIPLTLSLQSLLENDIQRVLIFEALAVNAGSALTPLGNPQNLYIYQNWNITVPGFIKEMLPLEAVLLVPLLLLAAFSFRRRTLSLRAGSQLRLNRKLLFVSSLALLLFIVAIDLQLEFWVLPLLFGLYLVLFPEILRKIDWLLLLLFAVMFVEFRLVSEIPWIRGWMLSFNLKKNTTLFLLSAGLSQVMSNVPAAIFVSNFSKDWKIIAYGVNVGGNGLIIGSLANLIALRLGKSKKAALEFHIFSIPFFIATLLLTLLIL